MKKPIEELVPAYIRNILAYQPGKPIEEVERELKIRAIKLASNENPLGPSPLAMEAVKRSVSESHRYPDGGAYYLREKLAARLNVPMANICIGLGTSEIIDQVARALLDGESEAVSSVSSFPLYYIAAQAAGARLVLVPQRKHSFDLEGIAAAITPRTRVVYLANPNNPTGTMFTAAELDKFLAVIPENVLVVLDEAYSEYVERPDYSRSLDYVREGRNVLVLRTFSKIYGLAGIRIGYGMGPAGLLVELGKLRTPFNTSNVAQAAALAALDDTEHVRRSLESNRAGLKQLGDGLQKLGLRWVPSVTNFIYVELESDAQSLAEALLRRGVIVRPLHWMGLPNAMRITVGTSAENSKLLEALAVPEIAGRVEQAAANPARPSSSD